ncbi:MAG: transcriptional regulator [Lachnospiraceae bacterium]|nr:transcriptional regulator [Lachnospiraceae bacterium]
MEDIFKKSILYDLYGGLLSRNQKVVYEYHVLDDLSFSEIGEELKISRQAAYDLYKLADKKLKDIDSKLLLSERLKDIEKLATSIKKKTKDRTIINLSDKIIKNVLKGGNN